MNAKTKGRAITLGAQTVGTGAPCFIIGEVAQGHDGSLGLALSFVDAIADAGVDAVKFQTHIAEAESTPGEPWRVKFSHQDESRFDYWHRTGFTAAQWQLIADRARGRGVQFLSSAFSPEAVDLLDDVGVAAWKVASGELLDLPVLERIAETGRPAIISTGMSSWAEIDQAAAAFHALGIEFALLQCTSRYPTAPEDVGLNVLDELRNRFDVPVGLSDHSGRAASGLAAVARGADVLEVHATFSKRMFGPDMSSSLTMEDLATLVQDIRYIESVLRHPVDKDAMAVSLAEMHDLFTKSMVAAVDIAPGTVLRRELVQVKKPGGGIPPTEIGAHLGRTVRRAVPKHQQLSEDDFGK